jgi:hypothetical protein
MSCIIQHMFIMIRSLEFEPTLVHILKRTGQTDFIIRISCRSLTLVKVRQTSYFNEREQCNEILVRSYSGSFIP